MVYEWKKGSRIKADPDKIGQELEEIGEQISPVEIVKKAKNKYTELYNCFEWDNGKAAEQYRLEQARDIMRSLVIIEERIEEISGKAIEMQIRVYENVNIGETKRVYIPTRIALKNPDMKMQIFGRLEEMLREAQTITENYEYLSGKLKLGGRKIKEAREIINAV
ncbi:MAG: hypothetical protein PHX80_04010 [Candidatus Nanoarchaeia archaeon]|nr:hypothetical protein [Candidatus Nanoarchaeia archaeon]